MAKVKKQKNYAIKSARGITDTIFASWLECEPLVKGCQSVYKSFYTLDEVEHYLQTVDVGKIVEQTQKGIEKKKKQKATTKLIQTRIPKDIYAEFLCKCEEMGTTTDRMILELIREWLE